MPLKVSNFTLRILIMGEFIPVTVTHAQRFVALFLEQDCAMHSTLFVTAGIIY